MTNLEKIKLHFINEQLMEWNDNHGHVCSSNSITNALEALAEETSRTAEVTRRCKAIAISDNQEQLKDIYMGFSEEEYYYDLLNEVEL